MVAAEKIEHRGGSGANDLNIETEETMDEKCETRNQHD